MSYYISMSDICFNIKNENKETALLLLKNLIKTRQNLSWINNDTILRAETLDEALRECRYEIEEDDNGNAYYMAFTGEKSGDDYEIFKAIAPAVEDGSYIEMTGDDGDKWRWVFKEGECSEIDPKIEWNTVKNVNENMLKTAIFIELDKFRELLKKLPAIARM